MQLKWKKIFSNTLLLLTARVISKIATVAVMVYAAHSLGTNLFGVFSAVIALTQFSGLISDFGLVMPTIRNISIQTNNHTDIVADTFSARIFWSIIALITLAIGGLIMKFSLIIVILLVVSSILEYSALALVRSFEGKQQIQIVTFYTLVERFYFSIIVVFTFWKFESLEAVAIAYLFSFLSTFIFAWYLFKKGIGKLKLEFNILKLKSMTKLGFPFFLTAIFSALYYRADILLLSWFRSDAEVGIYNAALRIIDAHIFIPTAIMASIFPTLSQLFQSGSPDFYRTLIRLLLIFILMGIAVTFFIYFAAPLFITFLYPNTFHNSTIILKILSLTLLFYFIYFFLAHCLIAINKEKLFTTAMFFPTLLNATSNYLIIPSYGYIGAAWVRVGSEIFLCILLTIFLFKHISKYRITDNYNMINNTINKSPPIY